MRNAAPINDISYTLLNARRMARRRQLRIQLVEEVASFCIRVLLTIFVMISGLVAWLLTWAEFSYLLSACALFLTFASGFLIRSCWRALMRVQGTMLSLGMRGNK